MKISVNVKTPPVADAVRRIRRRVEEETARAISTARAAVSLTTKEPGQ